MSGRSRGTAGVLALVIGSAVLAGCGPSDGGAGAAARATPAPTSTAPTVPTRPGTPTPSIPGGPHAPSLRVTGMIQEGSKPQCRLLVTRRTSYLLLGVHQRLLVGKRVTVVGVVLDNVRTMCPGVPLGVVAVAGRAPAPPGPPTAPTPPP